jgi:hypothetical protein
MGKHGDSLARRARVPAATYRDRDREGAPMFGRGKRRVEEQRVEEQRAKYVANWEQVRSWVAGWDCPEVAWPDVPANPFFTGGASERAWLEQHAPFQDQYHWIVVGRPLAEGITEFTGSWWFGAGHQFDRLEIRTQTVADPAYLAERLATGVHAAALKGWRDADLQPFYEWLFEGLDSRPMTEGVKGRTRHGFVVVDLMRVPLALTPGIGVQLTVGLTGTGLDGTPLDGDGVAHPRS